MPVAFVVDAVPSTGLTFAATTQTALTTGLKIFDIVPPASKVKDIDTSNHSTSGGATYIASKIIENGEIKLTVGLNADTVMSTYFGVSDTWTLTFPKSPSSATTAANIAFSGYVKDWAPKTPFEDKMTGELTIKVSGSITYTAQA